MDLRVIDARDLAFKQRFDCVSFSFNGIDTVTYEDRQVILQHVADALKPGGYFVYSTHNLHHSRTASWANDFWVDELYKPWKRMRYFPNRLKNFWRQSFDKEHSIAYVNDPGLGFALFNAYVDIRAEIETLGRYGFTVFKLIGNTKQVEGYDAEDCWVYILARLSKE
jgi:SAM-dependent methyltransferase